PTAGIMFLAADPRGRIWVSDTRGLSVIDRCDAPEIAGGCGLRRVANAELVPWTGPVWKPDGGLWIGTMQGLLEPDAADPVLGRLSREHGSAGGGPVPIRLDRQGDLWVANSLTALQRLAADGLTAFGRAEGLEVRAISSILTTRAGELVLIGDSHVVERLDRRHFSGDRPPMAPGGPGPGGGRDQIGLQEPVGPGWVY